MQIFSIHETILFELCVDLPLALPTDGVYAFLGGGKRIPKKKEAKGILLDTVMRSRQQITPRAYMASVKETWFHSNLNFISQAFFNTEVQMPAGLEDNRTTRGILLMSAFHLVRHCSACADCKGKVSVRCRGDGKYRWVCLRYGHSHVQRPLNSEGFLTNIRISNWAAFLQFTNFLRLGERWRIITQEMRETYDIQRKQTLTDWRRLIQVSFKKYLEDNGGMIIGGRNVVTVIDETNLGAQKGICKGPQKPSTLSRKASDIKNRIAKRLPARTIWKKETTKLLKSMKFAMKVVKAMKVKGAKFKKSMRALKKNDARSDGRWLWAAVSVGRGNEKWTHENKKKKFTFKLLPNKASAPRGKPRGFESIRATLSERIAKGSFLVFDKWTSTVAAVKSEGYKHADPIIHGKEFRNRDTGFHSNDIESEFNRFKRWLRERYGALKVNSASTTNQHDCDDLDMYEYMYYINVGASMHDVMAAFVHSHGKREKSVVF